MSELKRSIPYWHIAWRNTRRNTRRTLLTVSAVVIAVIALTFCLSYINGLLDNMLDTYARTESGHVRIRKAGYMARERSMPVHLNISNLSDVLPVIREHPDVETVLPRIRSAVLVDGAGTNRPGLLFGLDLAGEEGYWNPTAMLTEGQLPRVGEGEVMVGRGFAEKLDVTLGDTLTLLGQTAYRSLGGLRVVVRGLAETGIAHLDNALLIVPLDQAQLLADLPDATTEILVFARNPQRADALADDLQERVNPLVTGGVESLSWRDQGPLIQLMEIMTPMLGVIFFILLFMASLIIINTMLMTVMERTKEFGMLAAMGMRKGDIILLILAEGLAIGVIGAIVGGILGTGISVWIEHMGIDVTEAMRTTDLPFQGVLYPDWQLSYTLICAFAGLATAVIATLYPAWRAVKTSPAEAIRG